MISAICTKTFLEVGLVRHVTSEEDTSDSHFPVMRRKYIRNSVLFFVRK